MGRLNSVTTMSRATLAKRSTDFIIPGASTVGILACVKVFRIILVNFFLLTLVLTQIVLPTHIVVSSYTIILLIILFLYLSFTREDLTFKHLLVFGSALVTVVLLFSIRLIPLMAYIRDTNRAGQLRLELADTSIFGLRLFIPEFLGYNFRTYSAAIASLSPVLPKIHLHWMLPHYFGVVPILMAVLSVFHFRNPRIVFWFLFTVAAVAVNLNCEPFDMIARAVLPNLYHPLGLAIYVPIAFCMLIGHTALRVSDSTELNFECRHAFLLLGAVLFVTMSFFTLWFYHALPYRPWIRTVYSSVFLCVLALVALAALLLRFLPNQPPLRRKRLTTPCQGESSSHFPIRRGCRTGAGIQILPATAIRRTGRLPRALKSRTS